MPFLRRVALILALVLPLAAQAQRDAPEPELKAAILANMMMFIDWPEQGGQPRDRVSVCHLGDSPVAAALLRLDGRVVRGRPLRVQRVEDGQVEQCHAVYLAPAEMLRPEGPIRSARGVLLAGDAPGFLARGGMVNLELVGGRVVFDIDLRAARGAGLSISSKALRLARIVLE